VKSRISIVPLVLTLAVASLGTSEAQTQSPTSSRTVSAGEFSSLSPERQRERYAALLDDVGVASKSISSLKTMKEPNLLAWIQKEQEAIAAQQKKIDADKANQNKLRELNRTTKTTSQAMDEANEKMARVAVKGIQTIPKVITKDTVGKGTAAEKLATDFAKAQAAQYDALDNDDEIRERSAEIDKLTASIQKEERDLTLRMFAFAIGVSMLNSQMKSEEADTVMAVYAKSSRLRNTLGVSANQGNTRVAGRKDSVDANDGDRPGVQADRMGRDGRGAGGTGGTGGTGNEKNGDTRSGAGGGKVDVGGGERVSVRDGKDGRFGPERDGGPGESINVDKPKK
jgi:hypothetical protein